jgi:hypothetical protein
MRLKLGLAAAGLAAAAVSQAPMLRPGTQPTAVQQLVQQVASATFTETFDGAPARPSPFNPPHWDVVVHSRNTDTWDTLEPMIAGHGPDCSAPPATHPTSAYDQAVFQCRNHVMTAINASAYGMIYLTPAQMVDFSAGEAVVRFDMSTLDTSGRDWVDMWITPFEQNLVLPLDATLPDVQGPPPNAVQVSMDFSQSTFLANIYRNGVKSTIDSFVTYDSVLVPDAARRDTFELRISNGHLRFGMPAYGLTFFDASIASLGWSQGIVQLGHHSYTPMKDCSGPCAPNTWHWDNVTISPAKPFRMIKSNQRWYSDAKGSTATFAAPAPANARLRFAGVGDGMQVSFDGGASWVNARRNSTGTAIEHMSSYWMSIPAGTTSVRFRSSGWFGNPWAVRDVAVWSSEGSTLPGPSPAGGPPIQPAQGDPTGSGRLLDTRPGASTVDGQFLGQGRVGAGQTIELQVAGRSNVPADAANVAVNLTVTEARGVGYVTVYPCGQPRPLASNLNFTAGQTVANAAITSLGGGRMCLYVSGGDPHLIVDISGTLTGESGFRPMTARRLLDGRPGTATIDNANVGIGRSAPGSVLELQVAGRAGVPANASTVVLNVTATGVTGTGYVTVFPCGTPMPIASNLNFDAGYTTANAVITRVGANGRVCLYTGAASAYLIADIGGTFDGAGYTALQPARLLDTRPGAATIDGQSLGAGQRPAWTAVEVQVAGRGGVPGDARVAALNVTSTISGGAGYITVHPCSEGRPTTSSLNPMADRDLANLVLVDLDRAGKACLYVAVAPTHLVVDVIGVFASGSAFAN